ncbi:MAG TPA: TIGR03118 family protein [Rhizomicrobium sp.]|jgi:uncharacterized protein (TIGR03118 family)
MRPSLTLALGLLLLATPALAGGGKGSAFKVTNLVSNQGGVAKVTDPNLVNAWGLAQGPGNAPIWVSDAGSGLSTVYEQGTGQNVGLVVTIPDGAPTGIVSVPPNAGFVISENGKHADASFLFDSLSGVISGWSSSVDPSNAVIAIDNSAQGSVYTGLALDTSSNLLFAADFANNQVQVYDSTFALMNSFTDPGLPKGFAPFNVAIFNGDVYVAYAQGGGERGVFHKPPKASLGFVDVFSENGTLLKQLIAGGKLDAPWGMAIAPSSFKSFGNALLVGNLDNGRINAYDISSGKFEGTLSNKKGKPIVIDELWALDPVPTGDITFSAGPQGYSNGLLGLITVQK